MSALGCPECGHPIGTHSHDVGCMDPTTDGRRLERNQLGFCPCERSSLDLIAGAVAAAGADALREAAVDWQEGEWANAPRHADRIQERIANGQFVSDWLRQRAAEVPPDHAAVPCPAPPTELCEDCREPLDADSCLHNVDRPYCSACIGNCAECAADIRDSMAAEAAEEWRLQ